MVVCLLVAAGLRLVALEGIPPGLHYDEAANLILAGDIGLRGERPVFIASYTGKEPLFFYVAGGLVRLLGERILALRLAAAFTGLLTIAATYRLGVVLLGRRQVALFAAGLLAVSFWHLVFSRLGFRAITLPLLQALAVIFLYQGLGAREPAGRRVGLFLGGLFLGLAGYTYLAARLFPIVLLVGAIPLLVKPSLMRRYLPTLAGVVGIGGIVLLPLLLYFAARPDAFWVRIQQVSPDETALTVWEGIGRSLLMVGFRGDPYWRFNLPGMPLFNAFWFALLLIGAGLLAGRLMRSRRPVERSALLLLLAAPPIMLLPTALATNEILPSNLRAIGMLPFLMIWPAAGFDGIISWFRPGESAGRMPGTLFLGGFAALVLGGILLGQGWLTGRGYFTNWATRADLFYENDADLAALAAYLNENELPGEVFLAARFDRHPTVAALAHAYDAIKWLPEGQALVFPPERPATLIFPHSVPAPEWTAAWLQAARVETGPAGPDGRPLFTLYHFDRPPEVLPPMARQANFGYALEVSGYAIGTGTGGGGLPLTVFARVLERPAAELVPFVHVEDSWGVRWSQIEADGYPSRQWTAGERVVQRFEIPLPAGMPPGFYRVKVGWFEPASGQQVARFDAAGRYGGTALIIEAVPVLAGPPPDRKPRAPRGERIAIRPDLEVLGYEPFPAEVQTGERLGVGIWWWATAAQPRLIARYELLRPDNTGIILADTQPAYGTFPFDRWGPARFVIDRQLLTIPHTLPAGDYRLQLRVLGPDGKNLQKFPLQPLRVIASERAFELPPLGKRVDAAFGGEIRLAGYNLAESEDEWNLTLVWQAIEAPAADYTIFVHLLRPDGSCCAWQLDQMPLAGQKATGGWLAGEVVEDRYTIPKGELAPGRYPLEIGLYLAESGIRLSVDETDHVLLDPLILR